MRVLASNAVSEMECKHEDIDRGVCLDCGLSSGSYLSPSPEFSASLQRSVPLNTLSLERDLTKLDVPDTVKAWVLSEIAQVPKGSYRIGNQSQILFRYLYLAYLNLKLPLDPDMLLEKLGIPRSKWGNAIRMASGISSRASPQNNLTAPLVVLSPMNFIEEAATTLSLQNHIPALKELCDQALKADPLLLEEKPKWVAVGVIGYYLAKMEHRINKFHDYFHMTHQTVKGCINKVALALTPPS